MEYWDPLQLSRSFYAKFSSTPLLHHSSTPMVSLNLMPTGFAKTSGLRLIACL
jgi:hypothetical protein